MESRQVKTITEELDTQNKAEVPPREAYFGVWTLVLFTMPGIERV
jgi:hypothetical protein